MPHRKASPYWLTFSVLAILVVASVSFAFLFEVQLNTKNEIRKSLFEKAEGEQIKTTRTIAGKIASDLDSIMSRLGQLADTQDLQEGHFTTPSVDVLLDEKLNEMNSPYSIDSVFIVNDKNILVNITHNNNFTRFLGVDLSAREYVKEVRQTQEPVFSTLFVGADGNHRIAAIYPIINRNTGQMIGAVGASVIATPFFSTYGNIYDFNSSQYINVLDRNAVFAASPNPAIVGQSFYDEKVQTDFIKHSAIINSFYDTILSGQPASTVFDVGFGERLGTGHPVIVNGKPVYFLTVGIPTSLIYSEIDNILASQNNLNYLEWVGLFTAVGFILIFLIRINSRLDKEVSNRTQELVAANNQLAEANKQLQEHDKLQKEFINIAAHELRTPITPILMALDLREIKVADGTTQMVLSEDAAKMIERNAKRLESLANDILTVSRIEGNRLNLNKEPLELNEMIMQVISDSKTIVPAERKVDFIFESSKEPVLVDADKSKLLEVLSNLIRNAIKFTTETKEAKIDVTLGKMQCEPDGKGSATMPMAVISIKDNGRGIDPEIASRLFQKFASSTDRGGTGIGLYVSKSIIEAHGGKIWGENNKDGKGAAFSFTLPLGGNMQGNAPDEKIDIAGLKKA